MAVCLLDPARFSCQRRAELALPASLQVPFGATLPGQEDAVPQGVHLTMLPTEFTPYRRLLLEWTYGSSPARLGSRCPAGSLYLAAAHP
jgi:hypothetical protein